MKKLIAILFAIAALGVVMAGCQKKEEGGAGATTTTESK